jgi:hypothetical protein
LVVLVYIFLRSVTVLSKWDVQDSPEAVQFFGELRKKRGYSPIVTFYVEQRIELLNMAKELIDKIQNRDGKFFRETVEAFYPVWKEQVIHESYSSLLFDGLNVFQAYFGVAKNQYYGLDVLAGFFKDTIGQDEDTVEYWLGRIEQIINLTGQVHLIDIKNYGSRYDLNLLVELLNKPKYSFTSIDGLLAGFSPDEVSKLHYYFFSVLKFNPADLHVLMSRFTYRDINSLVTAYGSTVRMVKPSFAEFHECLNVGYTNGKEFKLVIRRLNLGYDNPDLFNEMIRVAKVLDADDLDVLKNRLSDTPDVYRVVLKLH